MLKNFVSVLRTDDNERAREIHFADQEMPAVYRFPNRS